MKNKIKYITSIAVLLALFLVPSIMAERSEGKQDAITKELEYRYGHAECRATLLKARANTMATYVSDNDLTEDQQKITDDMKTLKEYAQAGKVKEFNQYMVDTILTDSRALQSSMTGQYGKLREESMANKQAIRQSWKAAVDAFATCNSNAKRNVVSGRVGVMNAQIDQWNEVVRDMKAKGLTTTDLEKVITDASQLTTLLNQAATETTDEGFNLKIKDAHNLQLHLWAQFHIAKLESYLEKIEPLANASNLNDDLAAIREELSQASALATPGKKYGDGEFKETWQHIKDAGDMTRALVKEIRDQTKTETTDDDVEDDGTASDDEDNSTDDNETAS